MCDSSIPVKQCSVCGVEHPATREYFYPHKTGWDGLTAACKPCSRARTAYWKAHGRKRKPDALLPEGYRRCMACGQTKPEDTSDFYRDQRGPKGLSTQCADCLRVKKRRQSGGGARITIAPTMVGYKVCAQCFEEFPATREFFNKSGRTPTSLINRCKSCCSRNRKAQHVPKVRTPKYPPIDGMRRCYICKQYKPLDVEHFGRNRNTRCGMNYSCKVCASAKSCAWAKANPEKDAAQRHRRRARKLAAHGSFSEIDVERQLKGQDQKCYWCREPLIMTGKRRYHVDHLVPLSRGGSNGPENIVCACPSCNCSRGDRLPHEWTNRLL